MAVCCAELALIVRITTWEASSPKTISADQLDKFEQDLNVLREFNASSGCLKLKVCSQLLQAILYCTKYPWFKTHPRAMVEWLAHCPPSSQ